MSAISIPMGWILKQFSILCGGNFAAAVLIFTLLVNLIMLPLTIKSQKSTAQQARLKPKLDALKKKCGDDKTKYQQATQELYSKEGVSMAGGCLPMIIRLVFMMGVYWAVMSPLSSIIGIEKTVIDEALAAAKAINPSINTELKLVSEVMQGNVAGITASDISGISFNLFGLDLSQTPVFSLDIFGSFQKIWIIPILSFVTSMLSSIVSIIIQKKANPDAPNMAGMMLTMPLVSLWIAFTVPGAVGFYWACSNIISGGLQAATQFFYSPAKIIANDQSKSIIFRFNEEKAKISRSAESVDAG
ncbi:MAG: YidC/Oxa1 family membrane protein insertase [Oscillospiraceae bacterium]|nr:YidC/Oxa1 family membrane protein insertase [Oscillospiraceae bacterium]